MKSVLAISMFCLAMNASADCPVKRPGELPVLPDGAVASQQEMHRAQLSAEKYMLQAEAYMDCQVMNRRQHLALVGELEKFSENYNNEMIEFQVRSSIARQQ